jgi:DNA replicative helicase MCM subunit Mcm2 (Cdc46/Mcm family)
MEKEKLYDKKLNYFNHRTEEIPFEKLKEEFKVADTLLMDVLEELKENGEIYEPRAGEYKIL